MTTSSPQPRCAPAAQAPVREPPKKAGSEYVHAAAKARSKRSEAQEEADEAIRAVNDLDKFEQRLGQ